MRAAASTLPVPLSALPRGARAVVSGVLDETPVIDDALHSTVGQRLIELGFVHGVEVEVIETMWPLGDPLAVRVRGSTFALRRREASAILVTLAHAAS
ncbi:MAG: ferrous iron transport protein A [Steroidobacteraceae bacterium]